MRSQITLSVIAMPWHHFKQLLIITWAYVQAITADHVH